jgi:uncharacterized protein YgbK (DUF1537 family)
MLETSDVGVVADDLTGACDVAACFASKAGAVGVWLSPVGKLSGGPPFQVINTQSRLEHPQTAGRILRRVGTWLAGKRIVFKKIDAGLRGPIGAELDGLLDGLRESGDDWSCVVAPAAPSISRTSRGGVQYENEVPIDQGALSKDPNSPPHSANIRTVIEQTGRGDCLICDAQTQEDLQQIVDAHLGESRFVFAGSLGLAMAVANRLGAASYKPARGFPARRPMIVCGSRHPRSIRQVERAKCGGIPILTFDPAFMRFDATSAPGREGVIIVRILPNEVGANACSPLQLMGSFITALDPLLKRIEPDGLGIVGGETAYHLMQGLGAERLEVYQRHIEIIACARISGGVMDGKRMVCKGGSVGREDAVLQMISLLTTTHGREDA